MIGSIEPDRDKTSDESQTRRLVIDDPHVHGRVGRLLARQSFLIYEVILALSSKSSKTIVAT